MNVKQSVVRRMTVGAVLSLGLALTGNALAQEASCKGDIAKLCPSVEQGGGRIVQCLKTNKDQLSASCKDRIAKLAEQAKGVDQACEDDIHTYCAGVQPGGGRIAGCLKQNKEKLSGECKGKIADLLKRQ
jgi:hypothetical protein